MRGVILVLAGAAILLMVGYQFSHTFLAILLVSLVWGGVWAPTMALYDGVLVTETKARGFNYGSLRVWSSVAFIAGRRDLRRGGRPQRAVLGALCRLRRASCCSCRSRCCCRRPKRSIATRASTRRSASSTC